MSSLSTPRLASSSGTTQPVFDPGFNVGTGGRKPGVAIGDGLVFAGQNDGNLVALNQQTGKVVWKTSLMPWQKGGSLA